ncbi:MAG: hypothetical protein JWQ35_520 [Bacteriovoracaceae bacterium]|nr:hypothetical protein [Bacteriovoracaceae bacterium]
MAFMKPSDAHFIFLRLTFVESPTKVSGSVKDMRRKFWNVSQRHIDYHFCISFRSDARAINARK